MGSTRMTCVVMAVEERGAGHVDAAVAGAVGTETEEKIGTEIETVIVTEIIGLETETVIMAGAKEAAEKDEIGTEIGIEEIEEAQGITIENGIEIAPEAEMKEMMIMIGIAATTQATVKEFGVRNVIVGKGQGVVEAEGEKAIQMAVIINAIETGAVTIQMIEVNVMIEIEIGGSQVMMIEKVRRA